MFITDKNELIKFYSYNRVWQLVPGVERTKNGRLFCTFYSGAESETLGNYCVLIKSDDDGQSWTEPIAVAYDGEMHRCFDPVVWIDPLGRLWFTWSRGHEDGLYGVICENPDDEKLIWSEEFYIGRNVMMNKPTVLSSGEWLFPIAIWNYWYVDDTLKQKRDYTELYVEKYFNNNDNLSGANVYKTVDNGKSFTIIGGCRNIQNRSCDEHIIYEKENGVLVMLIRTFGGISRSFSYDRGVTWTDAFDSGIPGPSARFHIKRLKSGRMLLINHDNFKGRNNLTAFLSEDEGETWPYKLLLDERDEVSYPDVAEGDDGYLYIIYDHERGGYKKSLEEAQECAREILIAKINERDIIDGIVNSKESYLKKTVSKLLDYKGNRNLYTIFPEIDADEFVNTVINYDKEQILENLFVYYSCHFQSMTFENVKKIDLIIEKIKEYYMDKACLKNYLKRAVDLLDSVALKEENNRKDIIINSLIDCLRNDLNNDINLEEFSKEHSVSVYFIYHIFKKKTGFDIYKYRDICRVIQMKKLLIETDMDIVDICKMIGVKDVSGFIDRFAEMENMSYQKYREYNTRGYK